MDSDVQTRARGLGDSDLKVIVDDVSNPTPVDSDNDAAETKENDKSTHDSKNAVATEESKDENKKKDSVGGKGDENFEFVENQLNPPPNLRLLRRQESEIEVEWDVDSSIAQDDPDQWHYLVTYKTLNDNEIDNKDNNKNDKNKENNETDKVNTSIGRTKGVAHGKTRVVLTGVSANERYSICVSISDVLNHFKKSDWSKPLVVGKYGVCFLLFFFRATRPLLGTQSLVFIFSLCCDSGDSVELRFKLVFTYNCCLTFVTFLCNFEHRPFVH